MEKEMKKTNDEKADIMWEIKKLIQKAASNRAEAIGLLEAVKHGYLTDSWESTKKKDE